MLGTTHDESCKLKATPVRPCSRTIGHMSGDVRCGRPTRKLHRKTCNELLDSGDRPMRLHRPGFVADREHDALIELRCSWPACRATYLVPYDELVARQREGSLSGTDCYAVRSPGHRVARLIPKVQRGSQMAVRATGVSAGRVPLR